MQAIFKDGIPLPRNETIYHCVFTSMVFLPEAALQYQKIALSRSVDTCSRSQAVTHAKGGQTNRPDGGHFLCKDFNQLKEQAYGRALSEEIPEGLNGGTAIMTNQTPARDSKAKKIGAPPSGLQIEEID